MRKPLNYIKIVLTVVLVTMLSQNVQAQLIDKIVAQVGDEIIMLSDIEQRKLQMIQEGVEVTSSNDSEILEKVLYQKLLINQAQLDSLVVSDDMVNGEMEQRIRYFQDQIGGKEELEKLLEKQKEIQEKLQKAKDKLDENIEKQEEMDEQKEEI